MKEEKSNEEKEIEEKIDLDENSLCEEDKPILEDIKRKNPLYKEMLNKGFQAGKQFAETKSTKRTKEIIEEAFISLKKHFDFVKKEALKNKDRDYLTATEDMERVSLGYIKELLSKINNHSQQTKEFYPNETTESGFELGSSKPADTEPEINSLLPIKIKDSSGSSNSKENNQVCERKK